MNEQVNQQGPDSGGTSSTPREGGMHNGLNPLTGQRDVGKVALRQTDETFQGNYHGKSRDFHGRTPKATVPAVEPLTPAQIARIQRQEHFKESFFRLTNLHQIMSEFSVAHHTFRTTTRDLWLRELELAIAGMRVFLPRERKDSANGETESEDDNTDTVSKESVQEDV